MNGRRQRRIRGNDSCSVYGSVLILTIGILSVSAFPSVAIAHSAGGLLLVPFMFTLLPVLTILAALFIKWPILRFLLHEKGQKFGLSLCAVTISEILLNLLAWTVARKMSQGDFLTAVVALLSPDLGEWYSAEGSSAHNSELIFLIMYLTMTAIQLILNVLPNAFLLRTSESGPLPVFKSARRLLFAVVFASIAPIIAGLLSPVFFRISEQRASYEFWKSERLEVRTLKNAPVTKVPITPKPIIIAPGPQATPIPSPVEEPVRPKTKQSECIGAAEAGDVSTVRRLLAEDSNSVTATVSLQRAAKKGHLEIVKVILESGASFDASHRDLLLCLASEGGHLHVVQFLAEAGSDINAKVGQNKTTALILASRNGHIQVVEYLLDRGADVNAADSNLETALRSAAINDHAKIMRLLLEKGADPNAKTPYVSPLESAAQRNRTNLAELLLYHGADPNMASANGQAPLLSAVSEGNAEIVELLLDGGANIDIKMANGNTPLISAISKRDTKMVKLLLDRNANVNEPSAKSTPLIASLGNREIMELLLKKGADPNQKDEQGKTPLALAYSQNLSRSAKLLEKYGAK